MSTNPNPTDRPLLLTPAEAAALAGVSATRLRVLAREHKVEHVRLGGRNEIRFTRDQVDNAVNLLVRQGLRTLSAVAPELDLVMTDPRFASLRSLRAAKPG